MTTPAERRDLLDQLTRAAQRDGLYGDTADAYRKPLRTARHEAATASSDGARAWPELSRQTAVWVARSSVCRMTNLTHEAAAQTCLGQGVIQPEVELVDPWATVPDWVDPAEVWLTQPGWATHGLPAGDPVEIARIRAEIDANYAAVTIAMAAEPDPMKRRLIARGGHPAPCVDLAARRALRDAPIS